MSMNTTGVFEAFVGPPEANSLANGRTVVAVTTKMLALLASWDTSNTCIVYMLTNHDYT